MEILLYNIFLLFLRLPDYSDSGCYNFFSSSIVWGNRKLYLNGMEFIPVREYFQLFITDARTTHIFFKLL